MRSQEAKIAIAFSHASPIALLEQTLRRSRSHQYKKRTDRSALRDRALFLKEREKRSHILRNNLTQTRHPNKLGDCAEHEERLRHLVRPQIECGISLVFRPIIAEFHDQSSALLVLLCIGWVKF
ncbi:hypothetical protein NDI33_05045 [Trichocoleus sp. DQ-A1]